MTRFTVSAALALLLVIRAALPASAGEQRPFSGEFTGFGIQADQRCGPDALTLGHQVSGVATHLGRFTGTGTNCTEFTLATEAVAIWDGIVTVRAADGSTLTLTMEGSQSAPVAGVASYTHTDTVVAGTGRFADAAGVLILTGTIDFTTFAVTGTVSGWLSY
jgi:hypothetical protein